MPWQTAPSLIIIGGAFNLAALLMYGAQRLTGEVRIYIARSETSFPFAC
jgi:hypothetical protein